MKTGKSKFAKVVFVVTALTAVACHSAPKPGTDNNGIPWRPDNLGLEPLTFKLPTTDRWELPNGLVVFYREDQELPRIGGTLYFPGGKLYESLDHPGLAGATGSLLREGSIRGTSPEELDRTLDRLAASIESAYDVEFGSLGFSCLTEDFDQVFGIAARIILEPSFDEKRFQLWKKHAIEGIRRRKDDPSTMAGMAISQLIYGEHSPLTNSSTEKSISRITRGELREYAARFIRPNGSILSASGSLKKEEFAKAVEKYFGSWQKQAEPLPGLPNLSLESKPGIYVLERDFDQSTVVMGHAGPPRFTPDIYEMNIYNRVLGSAGFGSRLFDEIRTQLGLVYDVSASISPGVIKGMFQIYLATRNEEAINAIKKSIQITADTLENPPLKSSFEDAKSAVERSFVFRFPSEAAIAQRAAQQELLKFPPDYDRTYLERMAKVSPEMVREVGRRWVKPEDLVIVVVGRLKAEDVAKAFASDKRKVYRMTFDTEPKVVGEVR